MKKITPFLTILCCIFHTIAWGQETVSGKASDEYGKILSGVKIYAISTQTTISTDASGAFSIKIGENANPETDLKIEKEGMMLLEKNYTRTLRIFNFSMKRNALRGQIENQNKEKLANLTVRIEGLNAEDLTNQDGYFRLAIAKETSLTPMPTIFINGFAVPARYVIYTESNTFARILLPNGDGWKKNQKPILTTDLKEQKITTQHTQKDSTPTFSDYSKHLNNISIELERTQEMLTEKHDILKSQIENINRRLADEKKLTKEQKQELAQQLLDLEKKMDANNKLYSQSQVTAQEMIADVKDLLAIDSLQKKEIETIKAENQAAQQALAEDEQKLKTQIWVFSLTSALLVAIAASGFFIARQMNRQKEALESALKDRKATQGQLIHTAKMASIGQLTAGVAHELNNPLNVIYVGISSVKQNVDDLQNLLDKYDKIDKEHFNEQKSEIESLKINNDYDFIRSETTILLASIKRSAERATEIVKNMRTFSRLHEEDAKPTNLNENVEATLMMLRSQYESKVEIVKNYGDLPLVECMAGEINQVFINVLENAIQAIEGKGVITITTQKVAQSVFVRIKDNGKGMDEEVQSHIFEPFFTTKKVGSGTGLGLATAKNIIELHKGSIEVKSEEGKGTEILITLPLRFKTG